MNAFWHIRNIARQRLKLGFVYVNIQVGNQDGGDMIDTRPLPTPVHLLY